MEGSKRIKDVSPYDIIFEDGTVLVPSLDNQDKIEIYDPQNPSNTTTWGRIMQRPDKYIQGMFNPEIKKELKGKYVKVNNVGGRSSRKKKINKSSKRSKALKSSKRARTHRNRRQRN